MGRRRWDRSGRKRLLTNRDPSLWGVTHPPWRTECPCTRCSPIWSVVLRGELASNPPKLAPPPCSTPSTTSTLRGRHTVSMLARGALQRHKDTKTRASPHQSRLGLPSTDSAFHSVVVNTWLTANPPPPNPSTGGTLDTSLGARAWEHARRRAEDGAIILRYDRGLTLAVP